MMQGLHVRAAVLALLVSLPVTMSFSQQKERNRKLDTAQKGTSAPNESAAKDEQDDKNEGDPLFRGMKYRSIGPFRGGRSITAAVTS